MIELNSFEKHEHCASCGSVSCASLTFGGKVRVVLCEFCKQLLLDMLEEDLDV